MQNESKNKLLNDLPFYGLIGALGLSILGIVLYVIWAIVAG
ncbi:MAG: hypothetical protein WAU11_00675 [Ignavibacteriaceae bacterium]